MAGAPSSTRVVVTAYNLSQLAGLLVLLAGVISMIVRFRRSGAVDLDAVRSDLVAVVNGAVEPAHISVWTASNQAPLISSSPAGRRR
jgi:hypothetical protein